MADVDDYESDPDDAIVPSAMRRREASDDEERSDGGDDRRMDRKVEVRSDGESDGQGAYEEEQEDDDELYEDEIEEEDEIVEDEVEKRGDGKVLEASRTDEEVGEEDKGEGEKKKENEPYAVPTAGAFYMHDDRFRENGRGRQRRMPGGRGLWESKDNRAWVHDRFEEMNLQDAQYNQGKRNSRGRFRGRGGGKTRGAGRGYGKGNNNSRDYYEDGNTNNQNRDDGNHNRTQKSMRGRGPRRYEPFRRNSEVSASQSKLLANSQQSTVNASVGRQSLPTQNLQSNPVLSRKHVFGSSLNSASPPFYPSGSSKQDIMVNQKRDAQTANTDKTISSSMQMEASFLSSQSSPMMRGKAVVDSVNPDRLYVDDSLCSVAGKTVANSLVQSSGSPLARANAIQSSHFRAQTRNISISTQPNYQPNTSVSQVPRISVQTQPPVAHQRSQTQNQTSLRVSTLQVGQHPQVTGIQVSSPPHVESTTSSQLGVVKSLPESSKSQTQLVTKGKGSSSGAGRGSFLYPGAKVSGASGAMGLSQNDQNFSATPALLPVLQFGGQHHGGLGVPAVGMALPGYMAQPQLGFGSSEMTWVPVLAGAAGALGASYPCIALDGSYYPRPSGQSSSSVSSREPSKPANVLKPAQRPEIVNDEFGQRHNKPRRYSEMNFGQ